MAVPGRRKVGRTAALAVTLLVSSITSLAAISTTAGAAGSTPSTTTVASSAPGGSALAAPVTYTATVAPTSGLGATPTGTVAFTDNGVTITGCAAITLIAGTSPNATAQCTTTAGAMGAGSHPIVANYAGDATYTTSSANLTQTVAQAATSTVITSAPSSPSPFGVAVTYTATVTAGGGVTAFTPTGTVSVSDGASVLCATATLSAVSAGVAHATCTEPAASMTIGAHSITSTYSADTNFTAGTGGSLTQTVVTDSTTTVLGSAPASPSTLGTGVTYTATVTAGNSVTTDPSGTVLFKDGATTLCSGPVSVAHVSNGVVNAACAEPGTSMTGGAHSITATYSGDTNFATSNNPLTQTVTANATTTTLATSGNNSPVGQAVTYTATVTPTSAPFTITGSVTFKDNGVAISVCNPVTVSAGVSSATASCIEPAASMTLGAHSITAVYGATANYATSTSSTLTQTVVQGTTTTAVVSSANPTTGGLGLTYTATVTVVGGTAIAPGGTVAFSDGATVLCAAAPVTAYTATCVVPNTVQTTGTHPISATYSGDSNYVGSTGTLSQTVNAGGVNVTITSPGSPSELAVPVLYTITVATANGSTLIPGVTAHGSLVVSDSVTGPVCTVTSPVSSVAGTSTWQCLEPAANMTAGTHVLTATWSGDNYFSGGTNTWTQNVNMQPTGSTTTISSPGSPSYVGDPVTYTASVNGNRLFAPTGPVAFYFNAGAGDTIIPGCSAVLPTSSSGSASIYQCTEPGIQMPVGSQAIHAVFAGDINYGTSTSSTITQVVSMGATSTVVGDTAGTSDPSLAGIPTSYTATITPSQGTAIEPTGTVTFSDNGTPIAGCTAVAVTPGAGNSTAVCAEASLSMLVGSHLITAVYNGDTNYITSDNIAAPFNQQVNQNTTTTTVAGPGPGVYGAGQGLSFTATVTAGGIGSGNQLTPTGTVTFSDASGALCTVPVTVASAGVGSANCTFSSSRFTVVGTDTITATYNGNTQYHTSAGTTAAPTFVQATPNVVIASSTAAHPTQGNASVQNASVTYTATISNPYTAPQGLVSPTGTATWYDTYLGVTTQICSVPVTPGANGGISTSTCVESSNMLVGDHTITMTYSGDSNFTVATNPATPTWIQHVVADDTTITLTAPTPANANTFPANNLVYSVYTPVTLQATLSSITGSTNFTANGDGAVTFYMNGVAINAANFPNIPYPVPNCTNMPVTAPPTAAISCAGFPMPKGNDTFTVAYLDTSGQAGYNSDKGNTSYTWQVVYFATNTQISSNPANPVTGQSVTLTAPVTPSSGAAVLPTGTLTFSVNGTPVTCSAPAVLSGANPPVATCTLPNGLPGGTDVIQATYPGDTWYAASIGSLSLTVGQAASQVNNFTITTSSGSTSPVSGQTLKFSVGSVTAVAPGVGTPTGTVTITTPSTAKVLCVITLVNGAGSCYDSSIQVPSGTQVPFTATYSGDAGFTTSTATTAIDMAPEKALVTSITTSPSPVTYGQAMTYTVTMAPQFAGTITTGTIAITGYTAASLGATPVLTTLCTVTLVTSSNNTGSCTYNPNSTTGFLPTGSNKYTATYSGDVNFAAGTTGSTTAFVNRSTVTTAVTVNPQNPVYGQLPSFAVTLTPVVSGTVPTGTVDILSSQTGLVPLCSYTVSTVLVFGSSQGSCSASQLLNAQNNVTFTAVYSGDANFSTSSGTTLTNVQKAGTTTTVTPNASSTPYGQSQTFTVGVATQVAATVPPAPVSYPTGTVTITTPGVLQPLCTATLTNGVGSCTTSLQVPTGTGIVYLASYTGDSNFLASNGLSSSNTVTATAASVTVNTTQASTAYGSETGQVISSTVTSPTTGTPTGTVTYTVGATVLCTATINASGAASCSPTAGGLVAPSAATITATYSGDSNFSAPSTAPTKAWTITKAVAVLSSGVSTSTVIYGNESQAVFNATVASPGSGTPTGTVTFKQGATTLCTATLVVGSGSCTPSAAALAASGSAYTITVTYVPGADPNFSAPGTQNLSLTVSKASTTTTLTIAPSTTTYGSETGVTLTSTVGPQFSGTPGGTVTFKAGAVNLCSPAATPLSGGIATCTISSQTLLAVGSYTVTATYSGDTNFAASSTFGFLNVSQAATTTTVAISPSSIALGHENTATFTPTLTATPASAGTPTGVVTITATNNATSVVTTLCTVTAANSDGAHSCSVANAALLTTGTYTITATYPGDANFAASNGNASGNFTVTPAAASSLTLSLTPSGTSVAYGNETAVNYSVSLGSANPIPTGTVTIKTGAMVLCTVTLTNAAGSCSISSPTLLAVSATNAVVATYNGDSNYSGTVNSGASVNLAITKAPTTTAFVLSTSVVTYGGEAATTITATVTPGFVYGSATGTVTIKNGATTLCTITLTGPSNNVGSCSPANTALIVPQSPVSLTATYSGDSNFTGSLSSAQTLTVTPAVTTTTATDAPDSVVVGQETSATFTPLLTAAPTTAGAPTGVVTMTATNDVTHASSVLCTLPAAQADGINSCSPSSAIGLAPGSYTITASYPGDPNFTASSGNDEDSMVVTQAPASGLTLSLTPSATSVPYGNESSVTYSVGFGSPVPMPTGVVTVTTGATTLCTITLSAGGTGPCSVLSNTLLGVSPTNPVVATYNGDVNYSGSVISTASVNLAITKAPTTATVSVSPAGVLYGSEHAALITTDVAPAFGGTPTGMVTVTGSVTGSGGASPVTLCTLTLPATTCTPADTALAAGATYDLSVSYAGDANFSNSSGTNIGSLTVSRSTTTTSLVLSASTVQYGISPTFTAAVSPTGAGTPTGSIAIIAYVSGNPVTLCTINLPATTCMGTGTALATAVSPYSVIAVYSGDGNFTTSTSSSQNLTVTSNSTTTNATLSPPSVVYGNESAAIITATIAHTGAGVPTGTVAVTYSGATVCVITLSGGTGTCSPGNTDFAVGGPYFFTATYSGDSAYTGSSSTPVSMTVTKAATTPSVVASPSTVTYGDLSSSVLTATVTPQFAGTPTGTVTFTSGVTTLCSVTLPTTTCTAPSGVQLSVGSHAVTATYSGDSNFSASAATTPGVVTITQASTTTTVSVSPTSVAFGSEDSATFSISVTPQYTGTPTGTVAVSTGATTLCTVTLPATTCATTSQALAVGGPYALNATYSGDSNFTTSTGVALTGLTVTRAATTTTIVVSPSTVAYGSEGSVTVSATVHSTGGVTTPTGSVVFTSGATSLCTGTVSTTLGITTASCTLPATALGASTTPYDITGTYSGDASFTGSAGTATGALTITQGQTATTLTSTPATTTYGNESSVALSANVTTPGAGTPTGTVTFTSNGTALCSATVSAGAAICTLANTALHASPIAYPVTATYSGDTNFSVSTTTAASQITVNQASTTTSVSVVPASFVYGQASPAVVTSVVTGQYAGTPTGTVAITSGATLLCTITLPATTCTIGGEALNVGGPYDVTATYNGDTNFTGSTGTATGALTVNQASSSVAVSVVPASVTYGAEGVAVITGVVTPQYGGTPTGTITISSGATTLCTITLPATTCSSSARALSVGGPYDVTGTYSGDTNFGASSHTDVGALTVTQAATTTSITGISPASTTYGGTSSVVSVHVNSATTGTPTGTVTITSGATVLCTATVDGSGNASCTVPNTALSAAGTPYDVTATYNGDTNYTGSTATATGALTVNQATTTISITSTPTSATYGNESSVTVSATVAPAGDGVPTGSVVFSSGASTLCTAPVDGSGNAACALGDTLLNASGTAYPVTAHYLGDTNFINSSATASSQITVNQASTSTTITSVVPSSVTYGLAGPIVSVAVTPQYNGTPTGTVAITSGTTSLCTITLPATSCKVVALTLPAGGPYDLTATYSGDTNFTSSNFTSSGALTVTQASTSVSVSVSPASVTYGAEGSAVITSVVTPQYAGTPTGTITISSGATALCTITLPATTCSPGDRALSVGGPYDLTATYSGDTNFTGAANTAAGALTVTQSATTTSITGIVPSTTTYGGTAAVVTVHVAPATSGTPTGTVTITSGATVLCTVSVDGSGNASCTIPNTALNASSTPYDVTATYNGDTNYAGSNATDTGALSITRSTPAIAITNSTVEVTYGNESAGGFSASVTPGGSGTPTGTVTFAATGGDGSIPATTICVATLTQPGGSGTPAVASCSGANLAFGASGSAYDVKVTYSGDTNYTGVNTTAPQSFLVDQATTTLTIAPLSPSSVVYGAQLPAISGGVTPQYLGTPTGAVQVFATVGLSSTLLCTFTLPATGCTPASSVVLAAGTYDLHADYSGDTNFTTSSDNVLGALTISQAPSTTTVSVAPASVNFGAENQAVFTIGVAVGGPGNQGTPTGTVTLTTVVAGNPVTLCTVTLPATTCSPAPGVLPAGGPYDITATYSGDPNVAPSTMTIPGAFTVTQAASTTTITNITPNSAAYGSESVVTVSAHVASTTTGTPTGAVTFTAGGNTLCVALIDGSGNATCSLGNTTLPAGGPYTVYAIYNGDANFTGSSDSATSALTITQAISTTVVTSPEVTVTYGNESTVTLSATVDAGVLVTPTGAVTFTSGTTTLCSAPVTQPGGVGTTASATCSLNDTALNVGHYSMLATYSGDTNVAGSSGTKTHAVNVDAATTTTALVSVTPGAVAIGTAGPVIAVSVAPQYQGSPTGTVAISAVNTTTSISTSLCTVTLVATSSGAPSTGSCHAPTEALPAGTYNLALVYTPDTANFTTSSTTTSTPPLTVTKDTTTTVITSIAPSSVVYGSEGGSVITTTVAPVNAGPGAIAPTGVVTVTTLVGATPVTVCVATLSQPGGVGTPVIATCSPTNSALAPGSHPLVATYVGDGNYTGSASAPATLTVTKAGVSVGVTTSNGAVLPGRPVTFTATITQPTGLVSPTGTVTFTDATTGAVLCGSAPVTVSGGIARATCTVILPTTPTQQIVATYNGDTNYASAAGEVIQHIKHGYWTVAADGGVFSFGDAQFYGSMGGKHLNKPIVGISGTADAGGYWMVASDGGIFAFGNAQFYGSMGNRVLNAPVVGMQPTRDGKGYWLVAADGGVFNFGDAAFYGSTGGLHLNAPVVGLVATDDGLGYFLVASDGGVFAFGDAQFVGGGGLHSTSPIVGLAPTPSGAGYWLAAANGTVYNYGDARYYGSMAGKPLTSSMVGIASTTDGGGYWLVASDGGVFNFGNAIFDGSTGNIVLNSPMVSLADI